MATADLSIGDARRVALIAAGLDRPRPAGRVGAAALRQVIARLGLLQIDYVNVLVPAQYQVPFSRLGPYDRAQLDALVYGARGEGTRGEGVRRDRAFVEQWAREASIVPVDQWPLLRHRMDTHDRRYRLLNAFLDAHPRYAAAVLDQIRDRGPLTAADLPEIDGSRGKASGFWGWTQAKIALEAHFVRGALAIADRRQPGAARVYDLVERIIPPEHVARRVDRETALRALLQSAARLHGIATVDDLADTYRLPRRETRRVVLDLAQAGALREVRVDGWRDAAYLHPEAEAALAATAPRGHGSRGRARTREIAASTLLSPFDPLVWHRARARRLFEFDYVLEIWVPLARRAWGYYVLPFLFGDRLVARVDLKADRAAGRLVVLAAYVEPHVASPADRAAVAEALAIELRTLAGWLGLSDVEVGARGNFARPLAAASRRH